MIPAASNAVGGRRGPIRPGPGPGASRPHQDRDEDGAVIPETPMSKIRKRSRRPWLGEVSAQARLEDRFLLTATIDVSYAAVSSFTAVPVHLTAAPRLVEAFEAQG